jgi:hypothetical protein
MSYFKYLQIYFRPEEVKACIVTCGGLCPGLNTVIREIVCGLWTQYGVREIYGIHVINFLQHKSSEIEYKSK